MSDIAQTPDAVAFALMRALLNADGKQLLLKGQVGAASRVEVAAAFQEAVTLVNELSDKR